MMKNLCGALFVLLAMATGCVTENPDANSPTPTLTTVANEAEALAKLDELARAAEDGADPSMPMVCDSDARSDGEPDHGICCWFGKTGSFDCVTW